MDLMNKYFYFWIDDDYFHFTDFYCSLVQFTTFSPLSYRETSANNPQVQEITSVLSSRLIVLGFIKSSKVSRFFIKLSLKHVVARLINIRVFLKRRVRILNEDR